jgi:16S rRNA (guanine527-N7)-methyltransferase
MAVDPPRRSADAQALADGAHALGLPLDDTQRDQLLHYLGMLQRWGRVYNLTAIRDEAQALNLHLLDSLSLVPPLARWARQHDRPRLRVLDVGSGGGLPGVVLAIAQPGWSVRCVDTVAKKARFIQQVALELPRPNLLADHSRVEALQPPAGADVIVSRAFASLGDFVHWTAAHRAPDGVWAAMKGRVPDDEIAALPPEIEVFHVEPLSVPGLDAARCVVWLRPAAGRPAPRSP